MRQAPQTLRKTAPESCVGLLRNENEPRQGNHEGDGPLIARIVLLEDEDRDAELIERELRRGGLVPELSRVQNEEELVAALQDAAPDVILAGYRLPALDGLAALNIARELVPGVPFIFVSGPIGEERAVEALRMGATDYVLKDRLSRLPAAVRGAIEQRAERARRQAGEDRDALAGGPDQRDAEALARRNELILDSVHEGICGVDAEGRGIFVNAAATRLLGWSKEELLGRKLHDVVHHSTAGGSPCLPRECPMLEAFREGDVVDYETVLYRRDGSAFPVTLDCAGLTENGAPAGMVVTFADLSSRLLLERQLEQVRRISGLGRIAAGTAHEFNNVLMGIQPFVEVLEKSSNDPRIVAIARQLRRSVARGKSVTQEILRFASDSELTLEPVDTLSWLEGLRVELQAILENVQLIMEFPEEPLRVDADSSSLQQVMTNLVINARDAMNGSGTVTIRARRPAPGDEFSFATLEHPEHFLLLSVTDTGTGIAPEVAARIFEPMFTTKRKGNGLGLAFAHQVVTRHGGTIFVESTLGRGASFHIFLPLSAREMQVPDVEELSMVPPGTRLLLVEDDPDVAEATLAGLELAGFTLDHAPTGREADGRVERFHPHAVVLDIGLPDESGFDVYERLSARWPSLPVIFASGHMAETQRAMTLGRLTATLTKPFSVADLVAAFLRLCPRR